jgi:branched-chain amino acid transport system substrate-binding protein
MKKHVLLSVFVLIALLLASCGQAVTGPEQEATEAPAAATEAPAAATEAPAAATESPAAGAPAVCAEDEFGCAVIEAGQSVKIGMGAPLTGDYASFGTDISQGSQVAIEDENKSPLEGFTFALDAQDDQGAPEGGASVANKLVTDPTVVAIAGHIFSGATEAAIPAYEKAGLPMLSPSATNPPLTQLGSQVFNRIAFTDSVQGAAAAKYLYDKLGVRKLAVMHDGGAYGQGLADVVRQEFTTLGGEVVAYEGVTVGEQDYVPILSVIADKDPEAVYFGGYVAEGIVIANQLDQAGMPDAVFFGCDGTFGSEFVEKTGPNGEGTFAASLIPPESEAKATFDQVYESKFGIPAGSLSPFTWSGYDVTRALISAVRSVAVLGGDGNLYIPRGALVAAVRGLKDYQGITGNITCSEVGECNTAGPTFYSIKDGDWVQAP